MCPSPAAVAQLDAPKAPADVTPEDALEVLRRALEGASSDNALGNALLRQIDAGFDEYASLHARIMDPADRSVPKRFIGWRLRDYSGAGLGNRLIGMVSTLAMAMATGRAFVLHSDDILHRTLSPVGRENGGIDWDWGRAMEAYRSANGGSSPNEEHIGLGMGIFENCGCEDWRLGGSKDGSPAITLESTQYFFPCVSHNPAYRAYFRGLLGEGFEFFRHAMRRFIRLKPELEQELDAFERGSLHPPPAAPAGRARYVIGLQIRTGHLIRAKHEEQAFYKCAKAVAAKAAAAHRAGAASVEAAIATLRSAVAQRAGGAKAVVASGTSNGDIDVFYFLATDDGEVRSRARALFGDRLLLYSGGQDGAVMDTFLLSRCDDVILTWPKSTFGSVGAALMRSGNMPHAVISGGKRSDECVQLLSHEPCFHGWFDRWKLSCYSRGRWETPEMLNVANCYYCQADTDRCPTEDRADQFLQFTSPLDYEVSKR